MNPSPMEEGGPTAHAPASAAGLHLRIAAAAIDAVLCVPLIAGAAFAVAAALPAESPAGAARAATIVVIASLPAFAYVLFCEASPRAATWGKRVLDLRVVDVYGARLSLARAAWRVAAKFFPGQLLAFALIYPRTVLAPEPIGLRPWLFLAYAVFGLYLAAAMLTLKKQSVHDLASGTRVIIES